jgi:DNA-binding beta-propeller fold protein YncE
MSATAFPYRTRHLCKLIAPVLLAATTASCGGGDWDVAVASHFDDGIGFYYYRHYHHHHHDDPPPPDHPEAPPPDPGLFLFAGDVCQCGGTVDGTGPGARFDNPDGIVADKSGNLYLAERGSSTIRKISPQAVATQLAGSAGATGNVDGAGSSARFNDPTRLVIDDGGNLFVTDTGNNTIRRVSPDGAVITLAGNPGDCGSADGSAATARFCAPQGIARDRKGNLFVTDTGNNTVRRIDTNGMVTTIAGSPGACANVDGFGKAARFCHPRDIAVDGDGNLFVADTDNSTIRWITPKGEVFTIGGQPGDCNAADGSLDRSRFCQPSGVKVDPYTNDLYVADSGNATIRKIAPGGVVTTVAGVAGRKGIVLGPLPGGLDNPLGIGLMNNGTIAVTANNLVLKMVQPRP